MNIQTHTTQNLNTEQVTGSFLPVAFPIPLLTRIFTCRSAAQKPDTQLVDPNSVAGPRLLSSYFVEHGGATCVFAFE